MRILVADDEDHCRDLLRDLLAADTSIELTMARDGAEAWWHLTDPARAFDLGIFDFKMPGVDGLQLIARLRGTEQLKRLPVIMCTGIKDRETVTQAVRLGVTQYVVKPYTPEIMREKIRSFAPKFSTAERTLLAG